MDKSYVMQVAEIIRSQLLVTTPMNVILSWGTKKFVATEFNGMAALRFSVSGRLFQGLVLIAYNELDYYEIYLQNKSGIKCLRHEILFDELGDVIDGAIEYGSCKEEYEQFCEQQWRELFTD